MFCECLLQQECASAKRKRTAKRLIEATSRLFREPDFDGISDETSRESGKWQLDLNSANQVEAQKPSRIIDSCRFHGKAILYKVGNNELARKKKLVLSERLRRDLPVA